MKQMTEQENLELQIKTYDSNYRVGTPLCTDAVYDKLYEELVSKFPDSELLKKGVVAQKISRKEKLPIPMYSLEKCKSVDEIKKWLKSNNISDEEILIITPKYDGISLVTEELVGNCWTRGDGKVGQKSNKHFASMIHSGYSRQMITFGEAIISKKTWKKIFEGQINPYSGKPYINPRNTTAGFFSPDNAREELKHIDYIRYGCDIDNLDKQLQLDLLNDFNISLVSYVPMRAELLSEEALDDLYQRWSENYQIDGLVIDIDNAKTRAELGREENMNPRYARAYKNPEWNGSEEVQIIGLTKTVSKQGKIKPVLNIPSTEIGGVMVSNANGINMSYVYDWHLVPGVNITVARSGDVIPKVIAVEGIKIPFREEFKTTGEYNKAYKVANQKLNKQLQGHSVLERLMDELACCPCCEFVTKWDETMTELICSNPECREKKIAKLVHFFTTLEIEEFGEPSIIRLYNAGYDTIEKILNISVKELCEIEGFAKKSAVNLFNQFDNLYLQGKPLAQIIDSLDLTEGKLGQKTIQLIFDNVDFSDLVKFDKLIEVHGIAESSAITFIKAMDQYWMNKLGTLPIKVTYIESPKVEVTGNKYKDQKICFTGCRPTKEQELEIQAQGGEVVSGVSNKTTLLVVKNIDDSTMSSSKALKAKQLGIKIITLNNL
jgi:NAD-dependent DNA ligase